MAGEKLVFTAYVHDDKYPSVRLTCRDQKVKRGEKEYNFFEISYHAGRKEFGLEYQYDTPEIFNPGTRFARPIMGTYGGWGCWGKTVQVVIDCTKQTYDVAVEVTGAGMAEIERIGQLEYEEAVAPKPQEIGLFEVMESNSEQVLAAMKEELGRFCTQAGVGKHVNEAGHEFARKTCTDVLEGLITNLELEISNEDWSGDLKLGTHTFAQGPVSDAEGRRVVKAKLNEILVRDRESAEYEAEEKWGVAPREPYGMSKKNRGEQIGQQLIDIFKGGEREFLNSIGDETARKLESDRLKDAIRLFLQSYTASMKRRVEQLS